METVKCIKQPVLIVEKNVKFLLNRQETDLFIVKNVMVNIKNTNFFLIFF